MLEMKLVIRFWKEERNRLVLILLLTAVGVAITLAFPYILRYIIDNLHNGLKHPQEFKPALLLRYVAFWPVSGSCVR